MHPKTGLAALKEAQLFDQFKSLARYEGDAYTWTDKDGTVLFKYGGGQAGTGERPEIDRSDLRRMLTESLPAGTIRCKQHLVLIIAFLSTNPSRCTPCYTLSLAF